jgi:hypothetical protein
MPGHNPGFFLASMGLREFCCDRGRLCLVLWLLCGRTGHRGR